MGLSAGTMHKESMGSHGMKVHQHRGRAREGCFGDWSEKAPWGYIWVEYADAVHKMPLWLRLM